MLGVVVLQFCYLHLHAEWLPVSQYPFFFPSLMKQLCDLVKNNCVQGKDHIFPHLQVVTVRLSVGYQWLAHEELFF